MRRLFGVGLFLGIALAIVAAQSTTPAASKTSWDGIYSDAQATRGADLYKASCASCHGDDLAGKGQIPPLAGDDFLEKWDGLPLDTLFEKMQKTMPATHPGGLERSQNADILAYILRSNKFPTGPADLSSDQDQLKLIQLAQKQPAK